MLTLDLKPSKALLVLFIFIYGFTLLLLVFNFGHWPWWLAILAAGLVFILALRRIDRFCSIQRLVLLSFEKAELQLQTRRKALEHYRIQKVQHRGRQLIILQLKEVASKKVRYLLCCRDAFKAGEFAQLQRFTYKLSQILAGKGRLLGRGF